MSWDDKSDKEINWEITEALGLAVYLDYCNSWADIGPLIAGHGISLIPTGRFNVWCAIDNPKIDSNNQIHANILEYCENPLRAAAICLIKKLEAENA